jgi:hypothetical protein
VPPPRADSDRRHGHGGLQTLLERTIEQGKQGLEAQSFGLRLETLNRSEPQSFGAAPASNRPLQHNKCRSDGAQPTPAPATAAPMCRARAQAPGPASGPSGDRDSSLAARLQVTSELPVPVTQTPRQARSTLTGVPFRTARRKTTRRPASSRKHAALWPGFRVRADTGRASSPAAFSSESTCDRSTVR